MLLYLLRHAEAEALSPSGLDADRALTDAGQKRMKAVARAIARMEPAFDAVLVSPLLRARQTAEAFWRICSTQAAFAAIRGLQPTDNAEMLRTLMADEARVICVVGHFPHLPRALSLLTTGIDDAGAVFPPHGLVVLERDDVLRWREVWRLGEDGV